METLFQKAKRDCNYRQAEEHEAMCFECIDYRDYGGYKMCALLGLKQLDPHCFIKDNYTCNSCTVKK